jgi:hypothetical protein
MKGLSASLSPLRLRSIRVKILGKLTSPRSDSVCFRSARQTRPPIRRAWHSTGRGRHSVRQTRRSIRRDRRSILRTRLSMRQTRRSICNTRRVARHARRSKIVGRRSIRVSHRVVKQAHRTSKHSHGSGKATHRIEKAGRRTKEAAHQAKNVWRRARDVAHRSDKVDIRRNKVASGSRVSDYGLPIVPRKLLLLRGLTRESCGGGSLRNARGYGGSPRQRAHGSGRHGGRSPRKVRDRTGTQVVCLNLPGCRLGRKFMPKR